MEQNKKFMAYLRAERMNSNRGRGLWLYDSCYHIEPETPNPKPKKKHANRIPSLSKSQQTTTITNMRADTWPIRRFKLILHNTYWASHSLEKSIHPSLWSVLVTRDGRVSDFLTKHRCVIGQWQSIYKTIRRLASIKWETWVLNWNSASACKRHSWFVHKSSKPKPHIPGDFL